MQHRTGIWQEYEHISHVLFSWVKRVALLLSRNRGADQTSRIISRNIRRREIRTVLMGRSCSRQELHRQIINLLLLVAALVLVFSMME